jgi:hypothetical protein
LLVDVTTAQIILNGLLLNHQACVVVLAPAQSQAQLQQAKTLSLDTAVAHLAVRHNADVALLIAG